MAPPLNNYQQIIIYSGAGPPPPHHCLIQIKWDSGVEGGGGYATAPLPNPMKLGRKSKAKKKYCTHFRTAIRLWCATADFIKKVLGVYTH